MEKDREFGSRRQFQIQWIREKQEEPVTLYMVSSHFHCYRYPQNSILFLNYRLSKQTLLRCLFDIFLLPRRVLLSPKILKSLNLQHMAVLKINFSSWIL
jgi:hypothetical protein